MFEYQKNIKDGMLLLVSQNRGYIEVTHNILRNIHKAYLDKNRYLYDETELQWLNHYLESVIFKEFLLSIALEQLQAVRHGKMYESLEEAVSNSLDQLDCSDDEQVLVSLALESFLFIGRSFLDVYMIFICFLLKTGFTNGHMSKSTFYAELDKVDNPQFAHKAQWVKTYFMEKVFGQEEDAEASVFRDDWGTLLRSFRDRIAHRDIINLSFESKEQSVDGTPLNWPTVKGITYHSFAETIRNGIHNLFVKVLCHTYELKWDDFGASAPYRPS